MDLTALFMERVSTGLRRKSITSCSRWASAYRVMGQPFPGPWSFAHHPWLRGMHDSDAEMNIGQKSAQMGYTETVLNKTLYEIDCHGTNCLYVLPARTPDASDFSASRFDPALEMSPHLSRMFSETKNVGHKRAGNVNLYIRGSRSRSGLMSVPVGGIVLDEVDEMTQDNISLAFERAAGQVEKWCWLVSTATHENYGINAFFLKSSQNHFHFPCPACSRWTELSFPESLEITAEEFDDPAVEGSHFICKECKATLDHASKPEWLGRGKWIESYTDRDWKGWYVNQLYSSAASGSPVDLAKAYLLGKLDRSAEQVFYNSKLGLPHAVDGARVTDDQIEQAVARGGGFSRGELSGGLITLGADIGFTYIHFCICQWFLPPYGTIAPDIAILSRVRLIHFGKVRDFEELDVLMRQYQVHYAVVDAQPERRKSLEFCNRFFGHAKACMYPNGIGGRQMNLSEDEQMVSVDRTSWLDLTLGRFRTGSVELPRDIDDEFRVHIKSLVRVYERDQNDNPIGRYDKGNDADHYAHALNYAEVAMPLAASLFSPQDLTHIV